MTSPFHRWLTSAKREPSLIGYVILGCRGVPRLRLRPIRPPMWSVRDNKPSPGEARAYNSTDTTQLIGYRVNSASRVVYGLTGRESETPETCRSNYLPQFRHLKYLGPLYS
jgi:hypothetical protein